ncbi:uncharacterized protein B0H18DRAFT_945218, partial [Fomitopsis serialis]|uniref:uncharacterized protein n=1 Tax=Fomitopsis serialis TaxID=139415 RepID=UPI00200868A7
MNRAILEYVKRGHIGARQSPPLDPMSPPQRLLPAPPSTHGLSSTTFRPPPLDGSLTLPELCDWHGEHSANHRLFVYAEDDGTVKNILWSSASQAIRRAAELVKQRLGDKQGKNGDRVVAILSSSDSIPYMTMILGIIRANCVAFPISTRNSPAAVAHLIEKTGVKHILVGREQAMRELVAQSLEVLRTQYPAFPQPELSPMPVFAELYTSDDSDEALSSVDAPYERQDSDTLALILHSSGSTAFPKPIPATLQRLLQFARAPCYGERDLADKIMSLHGNPMYHAMGCTITSFAISSGLCIGLPAPKYPPPSLTAGLTIRGAMATHSDYILAAPSMIEKWSRDPDYVKWLSGCSGVLYGGGPINKEVGDYLVSCGVPLFTEYGCTECGAVSTFLEAELPGEDWQYFRFAYSLNVRFESHGKDQYECIIMANEVLYPHVVNTRVDGLDGYATSDVVEQHPTKEGYWRVLGRTDDQIMHSTGEKTNPGPLESTTNQDLHVAASVMFGRGRLQTGLLVEPKAEYSFDPADENKLAEFRNRIWPTVERINAYAPQHSRLFKEMILVAKQSKPFAYTAKHTVRRGVVLKAYEDEINALYDTVDASAQVEVALPKQWHLDEATDFVRSVVKKVMGREVPDDDDLFQSGCDSLQATYIRNVLLRAIRESTKVNINTIPDGFVYDNPTISRIGSFMSTVARSTNGKEHLGSSTPRIDSMHAMVAKYTADYPTFLSDHNVPSSNPADVVLVTGTTGSLGCHLLAQLAANPDIRRIYAFNRPSRNGDTIRLRQERALRERGLDTSALDSSRVVMLEGDLTRPKLGLADDIYQEMHTSVTHIIHNAWPVDFALKLASFEPQVHGIRALIDFALTAPMHAQPPHVQFTSSVGVVQNMPPDKLCAETPSEPHDVVPTGYAESKWVSEQILYHAAAHTALRPLVVRAGQICGGPMVCGTLMNGSLPWYKARE